MLMVRIHPPDRMQDKTRDEVVALCHEIAGRIYAARYSYFPGDLQRMRVKELEEQEAALRRMLKVYDKVMEWFQAEHTFDANCHAGDCDSCSKKPAEAVLVAACAEVCGE